jgi:acyl-CoA thioesterase
MLSGMKRELGRPALHTRAATFHFLSVSKPGPARLVVTSEKLGRSLSTATARLLQGERSIALAVATFAPPRASAEFCDLAAPSVSPPQAIDEHHVMGPQMAGHAPFRKHYHQRLAIGPTPPATSARGRVGGWTRFADPRPLDDLAMVAIADSWYPSFMARPMPAGLHAPTVDYTVHIVQSLPLAVSAPDDFILVEFETGIAANGYLIEDGRLWSKDGTLMAVSRQMAVLIPRDG